MGTLRVEAEGVDEAMTELDEMAGRVKNMRPAWQAGAETVRLHVEERFQTETDFNGKPWATLKDKTLRYRKPGKKLVQTAMMKGSVHAEGEDDALVFGTVTPYAGRQHFGAPDDDDIDHPARGFLPVDEAGAVMGATGTPAGDMLDEIEEGLIDHIEGTTNGR